MFTYDIQFTEYSYFKVLYRNFLNENSVRDIYTNELNISGILSISVVEKLIKKFCDQNEIKYSIQALGSFEYVVNLTQDDISAAIIQLYFSPVGSVDNVNSPVKTKLSCSIYGKESLGTDLCAWLDKNICQEKYASVKWFYTDEKGGITSSYLPVDSPGQIYDEFYPFIEGGISSFLERFLNSNSSILIFLGPPGTGKTSLIRKLITGYQKQSAISYEDVILEKDKLFIEFMTSSQLDLLILEDADILLQKRKEGNKIMNKLLNVSEGLVKNRQKKFIFTSNETDIDRIDEALIRPGRCFGVISFRDLSYQETCLAAEAAGLEAPIEHRSYPLSELFNRTESLRFTSKVGFL